ncbi:MAG: Uncharacterized protein Greene071436_275 [Parcubacteria group bacterium Greene0714_36]|nr:MAG: Uncharacterized protein Greene071436_275 [Parcubacteria group bacterium Greene0714_36]
MFLVILWYNAGMYNWSTDEKYLKGDMEQYAIWRLEQMVNFGLNGEKLSEVELRKYWPRLSLDPARRAFLDLLLHGN